MKLKYKKLPNGWTYLVSIRQIKTLVRQMEADIRFVEYEGTSGGFYKIYTAASLDARVDAGQWCYRFQFGGLPEKILPADWRKTLSKLVLADIEEFTLRPSKQPLDSTVTPEHRTLHFNFVDGKLEPSFSTGKQSSWDDQIEMHSQNRWWNKP